MIYVMDLYSSITRIKPMLLLMIFFLIYACYVQLQKPFGWDELEHIHSVYLVHSGSIPYRDFFQHHHPLMWYVYAPIFTIFTNKIIALWMIKIISIGIGICNLALLYFISRFYISSQAFRLLGIILSLTSIIFVFNEMEIRPDNLMLTFILIGYYSLLKYLKKGKNSFIILTGLSIGISFLFLQKAIVFIAIFNLILIIEYSLSKKLKKLIHTLLLFNGMMLLPILLFLGFIYTSGIWREYFFYNWTLNSIFDDVFSIGRTFKEFTVFNTGFFILFIGVLGYSVINFSSILKKQSLRILLVTSGLYILSLFTITRSPYSQYLLSIVFFGSILISYVIEKNYVPRNLTHMFIIGILLIICSLPVFTYQSFKIKDYTFAKELEEIKSVMEKSETEREGMRIQEDMNLFFIGHKYYWFSPEGQRTIKRLEMENNLPDGIQPI